MRNVGNNGFQVFFRLIVLVVGKQSPGQPNLGSRQVWPLRDSVAVRGFRPGAIASGECNAAFKQHDVEVVRRQLPGAREKPLGVFMVSFLQNDMTKANKRFHRIRVYL